MVANDDFDGKATHFNCFYLHINFEQKYPKLAIVIWSKLIYKFLPTSMVANTWDPNSTPGVDFLDHDFL